MEKEDVIKYWQDSAKNDLATARDLFKLKHYHWALFIYHLSIEKLLKAHLVKNNITPPHTHDIELLAEKASLPISDTQREWLKEIIKYNIAARYDNVKLVFYKKATRSYTDIWSHNCEELIKWLNKQFD